MGNSLLTHLPMFCFSISYMDPLLFVSTFPSLLEGIVVSWRMRSLVIRTSRANVGGAGLMSLHCRIKENIFAVGCI